MRTGSNHRQPGVVGIGQSSGGRIRAQFEGAGTSYRLGGKGLGTSHINGEAARSLTNLRKRSIHAVRNHAYARTALTQFVDATIGTGIVAKWQNAELQALWDIWCRACDADGLDNFAALQSLIGCESFHSGEALVRRRWRSPAAMPGVVPLRIQVLSGSQLDEHDNDPLQNIVCGIQHNNQGERTFYRFNITPNGGGFTQKIRVPAADVAHLFERMEAGQVRGIPILSAILVRLYELDEMQDSTLLRAKVAALFGGFVKRSKTQPGMPQESNSAPEQGNLGAPVGDSDDGTVIEKIVAGAMHYLDEDEDVIFPDLPDVGNNYAVWLKTELRAVAKAIGLTYEQLTGDLEGVSYSSIRAGLLEFKRRVLVMQWNLFIPRICDKVAMWFLESAVMAGMITLPGFWDNPLAFLPEWTPPTLESVDRLKESMADLLDNRAGFTTRAKVLAGRGDNIDDIDRQLAKEQASELVLDSNPAVVDKTGALQAALQLATALQQEDEPPSPDKDKTT